MNKKKLVTGLLSTALLGSILVTTASPAEATDYKGQSNGSIKFKSGGLVTPPIDPPIVPPVTPPTGDFGLLYVPKEFNFQETAVPTTVVTMPTIVPIDTNLEGSPGVPAPIPTGSNPTTKHFAVGDVRGKRAAGWKLEAKLTGYLSTGSKTLTGATIKMDQGINKLTPATPPSNPWTSASTSLSFDAHTPDKMTASVELDIASSPIMSASAETGLGNADGRGEGYWQGEFTNIELNIPAAAMM
ncbi:WxL domain surface cell wall-binding [Enterococcus malodoratus]|uniref:WxL domain-containing protein n=1 Tax=Enterococcus malodoratus TaxID=71451 RepID=UPI0008C23F8F|nr:WxL domain-containing protein [Enterococcus malodoratus]SET27037.1 WxL domain surface cell wall-binding [Enterococcus malodoratus]